MNRSQFATSAAGLALASCSTPSTLLSRSGPSGLFLPDCTGKKWHFVWHDGMSKGGGFSYAYAYHRQGDQCAFEKVGELSLNFIIGKGQQFIRQDITFGAMGEKITYQLDELDSGYYKGAIVKLFKSWYFKVDKDYPGGKLYRDNGELKAHAWSDNQFRKTKITVYHEDQEHSWEHDWGGIWHGPGDPAISSNCMWALVAEFGASVSLILSAVLTGLTEGLGIGVFVGNAATLLSTAAVVLNECNR